MKFNNTIFAALFAYVMTAFPIAAKADEFNLSALPFFSQIFGEKMSAKNQKHNKPKNGVRASWYGGGKEQLSSHTANGEIFRPGGLTAAHRTLPFGTRLNVCYSSCTIVRINDRGPAKWTGRDLDLSRGAAKAIGLINSGTGIVGVAKL